MRHCVCVGCKPTCVPPARCCCWMRTTPRCWRPRSCSRPRSTADTAPCSGGASLCCAVALLGVPTCLLWPSCVVYNSHCLCMGQAAVIGDGSRLQGDCAEVHAQLSWGWRVRALLDAPQSVVTCAYQQLPTDAERSTRANPYAAACYRPDFGGWELPIRIEPAAYTSFGMEPPWTGIEHLFRTAESGQVGCLCALQLVMCIHHISTSQ